MTFDIVLAGVGGQGVLSLAAIVAWSALKEGLRVKQSEVHGMAQRGGAVVAHLRLADREIMSDLIPEGRAALILGLEPLESLRYLRYLSPTGTVITATTPVVNIPDYPPLEDVLARLRALPGGAVLLDAERLARQAGSARASNMVIAGAASHRLPIRLETMEQFIETRFAAKGEAVVRQNLAAFRAGREAVAS
jgi:indolepyruvate ferredoxin oxidoreductase beta subunit